MVAPWPADRLLERNPDPLIPNPPKDPNPWQYE